MLILRAEMHVAIRILPNYGNSHVITAPAPVTSAFKECSDSLRGLWLTCKCRGKDKGLPQQAEVTQGVPGRLRSRIFLMFGTTRVVGRQPNAPAAFTPGEIFGTHFPQGTWFRR
jgi:hypothetical protein